LGFAIKDTSMLRESNFLIKELFTTVIKEARVVNMNSFFDPYILLNPVSIIIMLVASIIYRKFNKEK